MSAVANGADAPIMYTPEFVPHDRRLAALERLPVVGRRVELRDARIADDLRACRDGEASVNATPMRDDEAQRSAEAPNAG